METKVDKHTSLILLGRIARRKLTMSRAFMFALMLPVLLAVGITQADYAEADLGATETTETSMGTITIPASGIKRIVGVYGVICIETPTAGEGSSGHYRLSFSTVPGTFKFPATIFLGPAGTLADIGSMQQAQIIPVDIPVPANETVSCYATLHTAQTGQCRGMVGLIME